VKCSVTEFNEPCLAAALSFHGPRGKKYTTTLDGDDFLGIVLPTSHYWWVFLQVFLQEGASGDAKFTTVPASFLGSRKYTPPYYYETRIIVRNLQHHRQLDEISTAWCKINPYSLRKCWVNIYIYLIY